MQPVQPVPSNAGTTTPATTERIDEQAVVNQGQESTAIDRIQELAPTHGDIKRPPSLSENAVQIYDASSMQMGMNKLSQFPDNGTAFYYASTMYASSVTMPELLSNATVRYARYPKTQLVSSTIDQEIAYRIALKEAQIAEQIESSLCADEHEKVRVRIISAEIQKIISAEIQKLASMRMDMNKPSSHSENAERVVAASSTPR